VAELELLILWPDVDFILFFFIPALLVLILILLSDLVALVPQATPANYLFFLGAALFLIFLYACGKYGTRRIWT
jgi:hypothetical protein